MIIELKERTEQHVLTYFDRTQDPQIRRTLPQTAATPEQVIWELHIKDFSWDPAGGFADKDRGKYSAFLRSGTTLNGDGKHPTGLDYLKHLGVTHIQLMPVYDYGSVDESRLNVAQFNWGYDPVNYNVPEGSYSTDPYDGASRVSEFKQMVKSLHDHDISVVMDVVYNHIWVGGSIGYGITGIGISHFFVPQSFENFLVFGEITYT